MNGTRARARFRLLGRKSGLFGGRIVPDPAAAAAAAVDIINVLVTVTSVLDIRLPNKWVRSAGEGGGGDRPGRSPPMWHPHAAPWGMQSERFNQRSPRERGAPRKSAGCVHQCW